MTSKMWIMMMVMIIILALIEDLLCAMYHTSINSFHFQASP